VLQTGVIAADLATRLAHAQTAWPTLHASADEFAAALAALAPQHQLTVDSVDAAEAFLWAAWQHSPDAAIAAFTASHRSLVASIATRFGLTGSDAADILSQLVQRLFVSDADEPAKFTQYVGRGQLGGLVRVAATRLALTLVGSKGRQTSEVPSNTPDQHRSTADKFAKAELQALLKQALEESATALTERQRAILRMHYVKQASIDDIAAVYRVHRATAARWLLDARSSMVENARETFLLRAALDEADLIEVASLVESQLSMTWSRLFVEG
jgi:RNA polymerase sigma-70 factor (ECF subfamily)